MKKFTFIIFFLGVQMLIFGQEITLENIVEGKFRAKNIKPLVSSSNGDFYYQPNEDNTQILKYAYSSGLVTDTLLDLKKIKGRSSIDTFHGFLISPSENKILIFDGVENIYRRSFRANYYVYDIKTTNLLKLSDSKSKQMVPMFSSDGNLLAYVSDNNIYIYNIYKNTTTQVTNDGSINQIINGATDWAYEEEFATTSIMSFSPDNKQLAFVRFDESEVKEFSFQQFKDQLYPVDVKFKYPKSGEQNSKVQCIVYDIEKEISKTVKLNEDDIEYIPRIEFISPLELVLMTLNRHQDDFRMFIVNVSNDTSKLAFEDKNEQYINYDFLNSINFIGNAFTYINEKDGYSHIYLYSKDGILIKQLTTGSFDVISLLAVDPDSNTIFYEAAKDSPMERSIHKVSFRDGKYSDERLSLSRGINKAEFSEKGKFFINNWSNVDTPNVIAVFDGSGKQLRVLEDNANLRQVLKNTSFSKKEFLTIKISDTISLNGWMLKPLNFDKNKQYPLLMVQYSGPDSQQVLNQFGIDWVDYLVTQGYIVACIDGRGTGARGEQFRKSTYMNLGIQEADDQVFAAKYFAQLPYVDAKNISIWGWSFGGYNVLMALSRSKNVFKKGVAIAPVTDWRFYDSIYTERYMRTPQENKEGYDNGSPIQLANDLSGELLLIHGSADDNVHFQNSMNYISSLIAADKKFEVFVFPDLNHSLQGVKNRKYLYEKIIRFLKD